MNREQWREFVNDVNGGMNAGGMTEIGFRVEITTGSLGTPQPMNNCAKPSFRNAESQT